MPEPKTDSRRAYASAPVNRRTTAQSRAQTAISAAVGESTLAALVALKAVAIRTAQQLSRADISADFTPEDRLYVIECVQH